MVEDIISGPTSSSSVTPAIQVHVTYNAYQILYKSLIWFRNLHTKNEVILEAFLLYGKYTKTTTIEYQPMFSQKHSSFIALWHILWNSGHTDISDKMCICSHTWTTTMTSEEKNQFYYGYHYEQLWS
jgi:hypothetical protein